MEKSIGDNNGMINCPKASMHTYMPNIGPKHVHATLPFIATLDASFYMHRANFSPASQGPLQALKL